MRSIRLTVCALALAIGVSPAFAAGKSRVASESSGGPGALIGFAAGVMAPEGSLADFNDMSYFLQSRSLYVEKIFGGRAAAYYGDTSGRNGADGGRVYGFDFDGLIKFGSPKTFGYVFAGVGYGSYTLTNAGSVPGTAVRQGGYEWCWTGGLGVTIKRGFYIEASYVSYRTSPHTADFVPFVLGVQF